MSSAAARETSAAALVTGASSGLGRLVAVELGRRGRDVVLLARDAGRLEEAAREVGDAGGRATSARADVTDAAATRDAIASALDGRRLDLVVHAAGVLALAAVDALSDDDWRRCLDVNVLGTSHVVQACLPALAESRGHVVLVSSVAGLLHLPGGFGAYGASKWAVRGYGETVRAELAERGVSLTLSYPSILDTPMVQALGDDAPGVYRAFPWHPPAKAVRAILRDADRRRSESFVTASDRLFAVAARLAPRTFHRALRALVRLRGEA